MVHRFLVCIRLSNEPDLDQTGLLALRLHDIDPGNDGKNVSVHCLDIGVTRVILLLHCCLLPACSLQLPASLGPQSVTGMGTLE